MNAFRNKFDTMVESIMAQRTRALVVYVSDDMDEGSRINERETSLSTRVYFILHKPCRSETRLEMIGIFISSNAPSKIASQTRR